MLLKNNLEDHYRTFLRYEGINLEPRNKLTNIYFSLFISIILLIHLQIY